VGEFSEDNFHGKGKLTLKDQSSYEGMWQRGSKHGPGGVMTYQDQSTYTGAWKDDKREDPQGVLVWRESDGNSSTYTGAFVNDKRTGNGTYTWTAQPQYKYTG
jgi:hypothetical protein